MDQFFLSNPGMGARVAHHIDFPDYSLDELVQIGGLMLEEQEYELSPEAEKAFRDYLERRMKQPRFANARSVCNALERARLRHATRVVRENKGKVNKTDLMRIEAEDILRSRVFDDEDPEGVSASSGDGSARTDGDGSRDPSDEKKSDDDDGVVSEVGEEGSGG